MIENFLHYVWLYKKIDILHLRTTQLEPLEVISVGFPNPNSGPDFFNGQLRIGEQLWIGNIEIHIKSSDWFIHNHHKDIAYDNVILHVVYEHDMDVFRRDNTIIPTLELKPYINKSTLSSYQTLIAKGTHQWINCDYDIHTISELVTRTKGNWEAILFIMLAKGFGSKVNGAAFFSMARSFPFTVVQKVRSNVKDLEALFYGQSGLLDKECDISYFKDLKRTYAYLKQKFDLDNIGCQEVRFFRLRPENFPTIRLSQLANLYATYNQLFSKVMEVNKVSGYYELLGLPVSKFWESHYTFFKETKLRKKRVSRRFIDLLIINTLLPLKFYYAKYKGLDVSEDITEISHAIPSENNSVIKKFRALHVTSKTAFHSQALLQLKTVYCDHNRCLKCAVGHELLSK